jgi:hypothetical protein
MTGKNRVNCPCAPRQADGPDMAGHGLPGCYAPLQLDWRSGCANWVSRCNVQGRGDRRAAPACDALAECRGQLRECRGIDVIQRRGNAGDRRNMHSGCRGRLEGCSGIDVNRRRGEARGRRQVLDVHDWGRFGVDIRRWKGKAGGRRDMHSGCRGRLRGCSGAHVKRWRSEARGRRQVLDVHKRGRFGVDVRRWKGKAGGRREGLNYRRRGEGQARTRGDLVPPSVHPGLRVAELAERCALGVRPDVQGASCPDGPAHAGYILPAARWLTCLSRLCTSNPSCIDNTVLARANPGKKLNCNCFATPKQPRWRLKQLFTTPVATREKS